jgi:hypothetical protein
METISSGEFTIHDVNRRSDDMFSVSGVLIHTDPGQDKPVIIIADSVNNELLTFDLTNWQCVSQCTTPNMPVCLYESDGDAYLHCRDGCMYHISALHPLTISTSPHGHVTGVEYYNWISHLGPGRLVGVSQSPHAVHVITHDGRQLDDLTTCGGYRFIGTGGVVCAGCRVVMSGEGKGSCLGREWNRETRVVCVEESAGSWSVQWIHDVSGYPLTPVIIPWGGTVIVPCGGGEELEDACFSRGISGSGGGTSPQSIVSLSLETGAVVQQVDVAQGCPKLGSGTCIYGGSLLVRCGNAGVVQFSLQGKMSCSHINCSAEPLYI